MGKNILTFSVPILFFMAAGIQAREGDVENTCCLAETNFYGKILTGVNFLQSSKIDANTITYKPGYLIGGSLGYSWQNSLCLEGEYAFRRNAIDKALFFEQGSSSHGYFQTSSCMANLLWNVPCSLWEGAFGNIDSFIGAGIGADFQHMHSSNDQIIFDQKWSHFAWQAMVGLTCPVFDKAEMTLEYKFHQGGSHCYNHLLGVGFVFKFDR